MTVPRGLPFVIINLGSSAVAFLGWAAVAWVGLDSDIVPAYSWAVVVYMGATVGLPFILPNLYRQSSDAAMRGLVLSILLLLVLALATAAMCVLVYSTEFGLSMLYICVLSSGVALQQYARCVESIPSAIYGSIAAGVLTLPPVALYFAFPRDGHLSLWMQVSTSLIYILGFLIIYGIAVLRELPDRKPRAQPFQLRGAWVLCSRAIRLVPHLFAFSLLLQGMRIPALFGTVDPMRMHYIALSCNVAFSMISAVHPVLAVQFQKTAVKRRNVRRLWLAYTVLGLSSSCLLVSAVGVGVFGWAFNRPDVSGWGLGGALGLLPLLISLYYGGSTLLIANMWTGTLSLLSCAAAAVWIGFSYLAPHGGGDTRVILYLATLYLGVASVTLILGRRAERKAKGRF